MVMPPAFVELGMKVMDPKTKKVRPARDMAEWRAHANESEIYRRVALDDLGGGMFVSTIFLGIEHHGGMWLKTMCLGFPEDHPMHGEQDRYRTYQEAREGHVEMCVRVAKCGWSAAPEAILCSQCSGPLEPYNDRALWCNPCQRLVKGG